MESIADLSSLKELNDEEAIEKLVTFLFKKPAIEKVSCEEIKKISLGKDEENPVVAFVIRPFLLHPKAGFISLAISEMNNFPSKIRARYIYNDEPSCPRYLGMSYITDRIRVLLPGNQYEDISLNLDKMKNSGTLATQIN